MTNRKVIAPSDANEAAACGKLLYASGLFSDVRDAAQAAVKILAGKELGIGPIQAMSGLHIVKGKIVLAAALIAALILRSGRYTYRVTQHDDQGCTIEFYRAAKSIGISRFTMDDARRAGLTGNATWKQYPRNMLYARSLSNGARWYCPDVFAGPVYTTGELDGAELATLDDDPEDILDVEFEVVTSEADVELAKLQSLIRETQTDLARFLAHYGVESLSELTPEQQVEATGVLADRRGMIH